jgi:glycyl-tRNA synthetase beta chain
MLIAVERPLPLIDWLQSACQQHSATLSADTADAVLQYILERLASWYDEQNIHISVVRAVLATGKTDLFDIDLRVRALAAFAGSDTAEHLAAANKRVANILAKADEADGNAPDPTLFSEPAEARLQEAVTHVGAALVPLMSNRDYQAALDQLAQLRGPVDDFFETVMVNAQDPDERLNRLRLLRGLRALFTELADLALLSLAAE